MTHDGSITQYLHELQGADNAAAQALWERYYDRLVRLARKKLRESDRRVADEEDAALSALNSFLASAKNGMFPRLQDRDGLWKLLVVITERKVIRQVAAQRRQKRGGGLVRGESAFAGTSEDEAGGINKMPASEPSPEFAAVFIEEFDELLDSLHDPTLRAIAVFRLEGYTVQEIASRIGVTRRTVMRKLDVIRTMWSERL